jgi:hypothetical protein
MIGDESVQDDICQYDVTYNTPGKSDRSSMPLGNGELAVIIWSEDNGVLKFYICRTDALSETDRTIKLGMVEVSFTPSLLINEDSFKQTLHLKDGVITVETPNGIITVFVSKGSDTIFVKGDFTDNTMVCAKYINWRTEYSKPDLMNGMIRESSDRIILEEDKLIFYHQNEANIIPYLARLQGVENNISDIPDELTGRIFGGLITMDCCRSSQQGSLNSNNAVRSFELKVATCSGQYNCLQDFISELKHVESAEDYSSALLKTNLWWNRYWENSYIYIEGDQIRKNTFKPELVEYATEPTQYHVDCTSSVSLAYNLTKYMIACCSSGKFPVYYNGMLFNLMPGGGDHFGVDSFGRNFTSRPSELPTIELNPDERSWCTEHLWQNIRHPYTSMLARGEYDNIIVLFRHYRRFWEINRARAKVFFGAKGQHNTEMTLSFGLQSGAIYGNDRNGKPVGYSDNRWGGAVDVSPGLELLMLMLDYFDYTQDQHFLTDEIIPFSNDLLLYIETRFKGRENGKIVIGPLQSVETYWDTINPITVIAGLKAVTERLLKLPGHLVSNRDYYKEFELQIPDISYFEYHGKKIIAPASIYEENRRNVEPPQMYAIVPFRCYGIFKEDYTVAFDTYNYCMDTYQLRKPFSIGETPGSPSFSGWQYMPVCAALLGLRDECAEMLESNCALKNPGTRFPAMWGPIYDAVPDTDHGANIINTLQNMLLQVDGEKIYLLPALPVHWNVSFKLFAPKDTSIECRYCNGSIEKLVVTPKERERDIVLCGDIPF